MSPLSFDEIDYSDDDEHDFGEANGAFEVYGN